MMTFSERDFNLITEQFHSVVRNFINMTVKNQWLSDDLTQETFIKAYKNIDALEDKTKIKSWLIRIAYNICLDHFKSVSRHTFETIDSIEEVLPSNTLQMGKEIERKEMSLCVQEKILLLPQSYRTILCLYDITGLTHDEIASVLEISTGNVKTRLHRARFKLKEILNEHCDFGNDERAVLICTPKK